ncbi:hypothetical protein C1637_09810 [Chryseobacterium lactis]|uniref:Uncharacterized protein n=1 Tax=Chryseobacterium lactis TaxID=1241981 RepID=A0A3G6RCT6_CHRLC|nr:hypothetical protein [Chryseobacterium lactis]AZA82194.1 hypothetical protein EG342_09890 [Chryseobacterium lactis]AZB02575.1 hypothetical protein EG341_00745 [Chryseobacterium lactis]PNW14130.1 hypothetical protein C1637_09810 [Chryseobacterium lactis]
MNKQQLLNPRFKVINTYPGCEWEIDEILDRDWGLDGNDEDGFKHIVSDFPHLFKPLKWFEERKADDFPIYVELIIDIPYYGLKKGQIAPIYKIDEHINNHMNKASATLFGKPLISLDSVVPIDVQLEDGFQDEINRMS